MSNPVHTVTYEVQESWARFGAAGWTYFNIAKDEYERFLQDEAEPIPKPTTEEPGEMYYVQQRRLFASAIKTVVFCGMALEAAIYDLAATHLGDRYAIDVLDKLDVRQKWLVVPRLVCGKSLSEHSRGMNALRTVVRARNVLVHAKSMPASHDIASIEKLRRKDSQLLQDVHEGFRCVVLLSMELNALIGTVAGVLPPFERPWSSPATNASELLAQRIERARELHLRGDA